jgi:hypothetical protein
MASIKTNFISKVQSAVNGYTYVQIVKKDGKFKSSMVKLSGYVNTMSKDPNYIYIPKYRHSGNKDDLIEYLCNVGFEESIVLSEIENAYTINNYEENLEKIDNEILISNEARKVKSKFSSLEEVIQSGQLLKNKKISDKTSEEMSDYRSPRTPKVKQPAVNIRQRLENIDDYKFLDISLYNPVTRAGVNTCKSAARGTRRYLSDEGELNRVIFDFTRDPKIAVQFLIHNGYKEEDANEIVEKANNVQLATDLSKIIYSITK